MIIWSDKAKEDLQGLYNHVYKLSPQNAELMVDTFLNLADTLDFMPYKFPKEPYINKENIRFIPKWSYKIIYSIEEDDIIILNIFGTSQDPDILFLRD